MMRLLHIGDIVGKPGRRIVRESLPSLRQQHQVDFVVANAENAAGGSGITPENFQELIQAGVDCITLGDHVYRQKQIIPLLEQDPRILRPANFPPSAPGKGWTVLTTASGLPVGVISLMGRVFMRPVECPFVTVDQVLRNFDPNLRLIVVDIHAEATSDKQLLGRYLDGRVSSVLGTHTHVTTADEQILPGGTAFQCDIGMTGPHHSILGREIEPVLETTRTFRPTVFEVAQEDNQLHATLVEIDPESGRSVAIQRIVVKQASPG